MSGQDEKDENVWKRKARKVVKGFLPVGF